MRGLKQPVRASLVRFGAAAFLASAVFIAALTLGVLARHTAAPAAALTLVPADLAVTKTDGKSTTIPGETNTYTIVVTNSGPSDANGATVTDSFPASLSGVGWDCVAAGGATCTPTGTGDISDPVNLPVNGSVTYTATGLVDPSASGTLTNSASVTAPLGVDDLDPINNSATDDTTLEPTADLFLTKNDSPDPAVPGTSLTYTIMVTNNGPSDVTGATVIDDFNPVALTNVTWECVAAGTATCTPNGSGNIGDTVNIPVNEWVTYTVNAIIDTSVSSGVLFNTATVALPAGVIDPDLGDNSETVATQLDPQVDLAVTKTNGQPTVIPGEAIEYTIVVSNAGPSSSVPATVTDVFPSTLTNVSWTCVAAGGAFCTSNGIGDINHGVDLPAGGSLTYTVNATVDPSASGTLSNTASVTGSAFVTELDPANNTATDQDTIALLVPATSTTPSIFP
jgi:uncharacterized repeat protein (TIGR01451 family)